MFKNKLAAVGNFIVKHSKIAFPIIVIAAVAVTVTVALNAGNDRTTADVESTEMSSEISTEVAMEKKIEDVPLMLNEDSAISTLILSYYNALALGDEETLTSLCSEISENDLLYYLEMSKYIEYYPTIEIYTKAGLEEGDTIAYVYYEVAFENQQETLPGYKAHYVRTNETGELYLIPLEFDDGENKDIDEYVITVSGQDDVVEFNNRITVAYNELLEAHPELLEYMGELKLQVNTAVGVALAQQAAQEEQGTQNEENVPEENAGTTTENGEQTTETTPVEDVPQYATATTTVNVRSSDSIQADSLGKVTGGTKLQVLEVRVNGWTKVLYERKEGYIKSEYLQMQESAEGAEVIGTVKATTNINVRSAANQESDRLGVLAGGDTAELIANEGEWCKIKYQGQIGYVKAEYVEQ